jgi:raffinose/stachyose/melibiose transport system substrate-binding protein
MFDGFKKYSAFIVIAGTYLWSMVAIAIYRAEETDPDTITLRIGHWQLEASVRDALNEMGRQYSESRVARGLKPVNIIQDAIPETIYAQWLTTQLMGGTAPDLIEVSLGALPYHLWVQYYNRYCIPLTPYVIKPNPYNAGTSLEGIPMRATFKDGMRNNYIEEMQEYVSVPLSQFGVRIFYNKDLLRKLTGRDTPPENYREFLDLCEKISSQTDENGQPYTPIAGSKYHLAMWEYPMFEPITYAVKDVADFNRDGFVDNAEQFAAFRSGRLSFEHPAIRARYSLLREITDHFQLGFTGLTRDEAVFLFAQQKAVFMTTGTWDARSLLEQAEGTFEVGVMDFPIPTKDDPVYGEVIQGPSYERIGGGFPFAITRTSKHPDVAFDFLMFMAAQQNNEKLNEIIGWIPSVRDTEMPSFLQGFEPHLDGVYANFRPESLGGETWVRWMQQYAKYQVRQQTYDELVANFQPFYIERGYMDFMEQQNDWRRTMHTTEQFLAGLRAQAMMSDTTNATPRWIRYRSILTDRQVTPEITHAYQLEIVEEGLPPDQPAPYEYGPQVLEKVKQRLKENTDATP